MYSLLADVTIPSCIPYKVLINEKAKRFPRGFGFHAGRKNHCLHQLHDLDPFRPHRDLRDHQHIRTLQSSVEAQHGHPGGETRRGDDKPGVLRGHDGARDRFLRMENIVDTGRVIRLTRGSTRKKKDRTPYLDNGGADATRDHIKARGRKPGPFFLTSRRGGALLPEVLGEHGVDLNSPLSHQKPP
jgi:hypothetical protein